MSDKKQVKVDNWGIYFLQRLKHFFNRTDYCDLTLQFQDNAQLKVHRLVLNACTEYFELLERTCEMYEDCLIMPEDLQADVVVPIVNFMYTGQLEFKQELLEKLFHTSEIMNIPVLTKLLAAQRQKTRPTPTVSYASKAKRPYSSSFEYNKQQPEKKPCFGTNRSVGNSSQQVIIPKPKVPKQNYYEVSVVAPTVKKTPVLVPEQRINRPEIPNDPKPTRYEVPEEFATDSIYNDSFTSLSYESKPLMVHPETSKRYGKKDFGIFSEASSSKSQSHNSTIDIVECRKVNSNDSYFADDYRPVFENKISKPTPKKSSAQLFDQMLESEEVPSITIEAKDPQQSANIDHAKIISEVLKKYPHLVKGSKNIKLKIVDQNHHEKKTIQKKKFDLDRVIKTEFISDDLPYETDVLDSKEAAKLIAMGAENISGPWICLICGTPGKALHFTTYYSFRRHLVDVHNEKPIQNICEYCGLKSSKRNYLVHHMYTKHNVQPPKAYKFPKCNECDYVGITEGFLAKHKATHVQIQQMPCNVCFKWFPSPSSLLQHIQKTGHKFTSEKKTLRCIYCTKMFSRESNLYAHLKTYHKTAAKNDNIIDDSDEEESKPVVLKTESEPLQQEYASDNESNDIQYTIQHESDGKTTLVTTPIKSTKHKILNSGIQNDTWASKPPPITPEPTISRTLNSEFLEDEEALANNAMDSEIIIRNDEFMQSSQTPTTEYFMSSNQQISENNATSDMQQPIKNVDTVKKVQHKNQPYQIVVSNEEEYKKLISSNESVIIDSEGSTKTLAVLTTPETNSIATTSAITTQGNDVMILPDAYPLNVSEGVSTSTGNIVVVYSHELGDANKQFIVNTNYVQPQLVTSNIAQGQLISSAAVITSNFATATTSGDQVVLPSSIDSWQSDSQNQQVPNQLITIEQLQETTAHMVNTNTETSNNIVELTQMHYVTSEQGEIVDSEVPNSANAEVVIDSQIIDENNCITQQAIEIDMSQEIPINEPPEILTEQDSNIQSANNLISEEIEEQSEVTVAQTVVLSEETGKNDVENNHITNADVTIVARDEAKINHSESQDNAETDSQESTELESHEGAEIESEKSADGTIESSDGQQKSGEQIQNLTSEWTEDEDEGPITTEVTNVDDSNQMEVEESIENIQQEVDKQVATSEEQTVEIGDNLEKVLENSPDATEISQVNNEKPPEKISSLLNEWDDNDSQEENGSVENGSQEISGDPDTDIQSPSDVADVQQDVPTTSVTKKADIRNLVNDWEEDEEESKI